MIEFTLQDESFKRVIDCVAEMHDNITLKVKPNEITCTMIDGCKSSVFHLVLPSLFFKKYRVDESATLCLPLNKVRHVLSHLEKDCECRFTHFPDSCNLGVSITDRVNKRITSSCIRLLNIERTKLDVSMAMKSTCTFPCKDLLTVAKDVYYYSKTVTISMDDNEIKFRSSGNFGSTSWQYQNTYEPGFGKVFIEVDQEFFFEEENMPPPVMEKHTATISSKKFYQIAKVHTLSPSVTIRLEDGKPACFRFEMTDGAYLEFFVAQEIVDEDAVSI